MVCEPHDIKTSFIKKLCTCLILQSLFVCEMVFTIHFNNQLPGKTRKVCYIIPDNVLSTEVVIRYFSLKTIP